MPIALFKLPYLVWILAINSMDLLELVTISKASAKTRRLTSGYTKSQAITMHVARAFTNLESVTFGTNEEKLFQWKQRWNSETDIEERVKNKITWLADTFSVASLTFSFVHPDPEHCCQLLEHARSLGLRFEKVHFHGLLESAELTRRLINVCRNTTTLQLDIKYNASYPVDQNGWTNNVPALLDCSNVSISCPRLENEVLDRFVDYWMQGTGRIQKFEIRWASMDFPVPNIWRVERHDGTRARVYVDDSRFTFIL